MTFVIALRPPLTITAGIRCERMRSGLQGELQQSLQFYSIPISSHQQWHSRPLLSLLSSLFIGQLSFRPSLAALAMPTFLDLASIVRIAEATLRLSIGSLLRNAKSAAAVSPKVDSAIIVSITARNAEFIWMRLVCKSSHSPGTAFGPSETMKSDPREVK
jgi:hypothetical protein